MAKRDRKTRVDPEDAPRFAAELSTVESVLRSYARGAMISFGAPTRCPDCSHFGLVVSTNHMLGTCRNRCLSCTTEWVLTRRAVEHVAVQLQTGEPSEDRGGRLAAATPGSRDVTSAAPSMADIFAKWVPPHATSQAPAALARSASTALGSTPASTPATVHPPTGSPVPAGSPGPLRVLVVGSNPFDTAMIETIAGPIDDAVELAFAVTLVDAYEQARSSCDVVLLVDGLSEGQDPTALMTEWQHHVRWRVPVILLTESTSATLTSEALRLGAAYVVDNTQLERLADDPESGAKRLLRLLTMTVKKHPGGADRVRFAI